MARKVNPKTIYKNQIMAQIQSALEENGLSISDGKNYGFTEGTIVIHGSSFDIQIKPIVPKTKINRYTEVE